MNNTLQEVEISKLTDHPKNPRLVMREDVIDGIAANMNGSFPQKHALHVRPFEGGFQILSGHHRKRAAEKVGYDKVWCWVEDMDDETAFMELATSNNQGELSPLEIGMHALHYVEKDKRGAGSTGKGLKAYATALGYKSQGKITEYRQAACVLESINSHVGIKDLLKKAAHLAAIHKLPEETWQEAVEIMLGKGWSAKDTGDNVKSACDGVTELGDTPGWLPPGEVASFILNKATTPTNIKNIVAKIGEVREFATKHATELNAYAKNEKVAPDFYEQDIAKKSINYRSFEELLQKLRDIVESMESHWIHGSWADNLDTLKDESIDLLLTDPPYGMEYVSGRRKDKHKPIEGDGSTDSFADAVDAMLPKLKSNAHVLAFVNWRNENAFIRAAEAAGLKVKGSLVWVKNNHTAGDLEGGFAPKHERIIHAVKGNPKIYERKPDVFECAKQNTDRHPTEKPVELLQELIEACTVKGQLVADPFGGVASTPAAAIVTERKYWACEIDEDYYKAGKERLS